MLGPIWISSRTMSRWACIYATKRKDVTIQKGRNNILGGDQVSGCMHAKTVRWDVPGAKFEPADSIKQTKLCHCHFRGLPLVYSHQPLTWPLMKDLENVTCKVMTCLETLRLGRRCPNKKKQVGEHKSNGHVHSLAFLCLCTIALGSWFRTISQAHQPVSVLLLTLQR